MVRFHLQKYITKHYVIEKRKRDIENIRFNYISYFSNEIDSDIHHEEYAFRKTEFLDILIIKLEDIKTKIFLKTGLVDEV